jgi:hypothetical protein
MPSDGRQSGHRGPRLCTHSVHGPYGPYKFGSGTQAEWQGTLVYAIRLEVVRRTRRGSLRLPVEAMAARAAWLVGELSQCEG